MDLVKIGAYIAGKRKALGLTQRQLAEKLGMSDKSVSKWERGICLPDVSVYSELCMILGITINEFLAGEDIDQENIVRKSEENIIGVAADSDHRQKYLKRVIGVLLVLLAVAIAFLGAMFYLSRRPVNEIGLMDKDSVDMKVAGMLYGEGGSYIFHYTATDEYSAVKVFLSEYREGVLVERSELLTACYPEKGSPDSGMIRILPDPGNSGICVELVNDAGGGSAEVPILADVPGREDYGRFSSATQDTVEIRYNEEQPLAVYSYDNILEKGEMHSSKIPYSFDDLTGEPGYVYYFSFEFCR